MNVLVLVTAIVALVSSALGIIVSVHSVKKLKLEIQNELISWGWPGILTLQFMHVVPLVFVFVILILLVPLLWTALWKSVMGA